MTKAEELYEQIAASIPNGIKSKMFGAKCLRAANGKAGIMFWKEQMVFKLDSLETKKALTIKEARPFDPTGGMPLEGWTQLPFSQCNKWKLLAEISMAYVKYILIDTKAPLIITKSGKAEIPRKKRVAEAKKQKEKIKIKKNRRLKPKKRGKTARGLQLEDQSIGKKNSKTKRIKNKPQKPF